MIAARLNAEGVPAPGADWARETGRADGKWQKTAVRALLDNERYIGRIIFNRYQWRRVPGTSKRRSRERPREQWLVREQPELRIIDEETWRRVRQRRQATKTREIKFLRNGREVTSCGGMRRKYLFSGILKCAECGQSLIICDSYKYGCGSHINGGEHACAHSERYDRRFIESALLGTIRSKLLTPERVERFRRGLRAAQSARTAPPVSNVDRIAALEKKIARFVEAIGNGYASPALRAQLEGAEAEKAALLAAPPAPATASVVRLVTDALERYRALVDNLAETLSREPARAQATLEAVFGQIPVDRAGRATITLDVTKVLEFAGAALPRGLDGSGGVICPYPNGSIRHRVK